MYVYTQKYPVTLPMGTTVKAQCSLFTYIQVVLIISMKNQEPCIAYNKMCTSSAARINYHLSGQWDGRNLYTLDF